MKQRFGMFVAGVTTTLVVLVALVMLAPLTMAQEGSGRPGGRTGQEQARVLADALGMTTDELREALQEGQSVAEMAEAQGVALDTVVDALVAEAEEYIQAAVEDGKMTQDEADEKLATIRERITERVNQAHTPGERPAHPGPGHRGRPGPGDPTVLADALGMTTDELREAMQEGQSVAEMAEAQGVALDTVIDALVAEAEEHIQAAVEDGKMTQDEADEKLATIRERITERVNSAPPENRPAHPGPGHRGRPGPGDPTVLADALGMTTDELREAMQEGQSVAEMAEAQGVALDTVIDALVAEAEEHIQAAVEDGRLTQDEADEKLATIREHITERVNSTPPENRPPRPQGPGQFQGPRTPADGASTF